MRTAFLCLMLMLSLSSPGAQPLLSGLDNTSTPLVVRQEKAQILLRTWKFVAPELAELFNVTTEEELDELQQALDRLRMRTRQEETVTSTLSTQTEHYLVFALARAQMLASLDFSEPALRRFYSINPAKYPCEPAAVVSEFLVPQTYIDTVGTTAILDEITTRLQTEEFAVVAYDITNRFGEPTIGNRGRLTPATAGDERFSVYQSLWEQATSGTDILPFFGPVKMPDGYLFIKIASFNGGDDQSCYEFYHSRVIQDYGREWLKKLSRDTLTTAMRELQPAVNEFTTGTHTSSIAYTVSGHSVTFAQARATLPFLLGNENDPRFWQSIQRQALDVELIYHSKVGEQLRQTDEFGQLYAVLRLLARESARLSQLQDETATTQTLHEWYNANKGRWIIPQLISYTLYKCASTPSTAVDGAECSARLELLRSSSREPKLTGGISADEVTSVPWSAEPREIQVVTQDLQAGEWSKVFSHNKEPHVLRLNHVKQGASPLEQIYEEVEQNYKAEVRRGTWKRLLEN